MKDDKVIFDVLASVERHIEALKPLLPKQALVCIGEYPIKTLLKETGIRKEGTLPILIEKSSDEIYKWLPKGYAAHLVLGFEDSNIDTHFWYKVLPTISKDDSVIESLKEKNVENLHSAIIFSSIWDGIGSAALPSLIGKFRASNIDSLSIAVLPSKIQPTDAHFNTCASLEMCLTTDGATVLLMDRDQIENYEGVDRKGELIKRNMLANYLLNLFLAKDSLVEEISELSRTFDTKFFTPLIVTGASYRIYGSIENMLNTALLKPFLTFDLSSTSLLFVLFRMPLSLKDSLPRGKIELAITNWFKEKTSLQSIYITEPIYTEDMSDRIDAVLFVGGFNTSKMLVDLEQKVKSLKNQAVEKGFMTENWHVIEKTEDKAKKAEMPKNVDSPKDTEKTKEINGAQILEVEKSVDIIQVVRKHEPPEVRTVEPKNIETSTNTDELKNVEEPKPAAKQKRVRRTKKAETEKNLDEINVDGEKETKTPTT
jgi:hypothetical protein